MRVALAGLPATPRVQQPPCIDCLMHVVYAPYPGQASLGYIPAVRGTATKDPAQRPPLKGITHQLC